MCASTSWTTARPPSSASTTRPRPSTKPRPALPAPSSTRPDSKPATASALAATGVNGTDSDVDRSIARPKRETAHELRGSNRRGFVDIKEAARPSRHSLPDAEFRPANRTAAAATPAATPDNVERTNSIARREIARVEAVQQRADQRAASRDSSTTAADGKAFVADSKAFAADNKNFMSDNKSLFSENVSRLNKVWVSQETNRLKTGGEDAKMYAGVKYERKQTGPFEGKLVSQGTIISIDGEDYVEYRVLTKPSFF